MKRENINAFWKNGKMFQESVIFFKENGKISGSLLYKPLEIIDIKDSSLQKVYNITDFKIQGRELIAVSKDIPYITKEEYWGEVGDAIDLANMKKFNVAKPYYSENFFVDKQLSVTYKFISDLELPVTKWSPDILPITRKKLNEGKLSIQLFGDSIAHGMTSSGLLNKPPFLPTFIDMVGEELRSIFKAEVEVQNVSESGMSSGWGVEHMSERLTKGRDVYIFAWGMNDGSAKVIPEVFLDNIKKLIDYTKGNAEFILIAPMLANPDAELTWGDKFTGFQQKYYDVLKKIENEHIVVLNMTKFHEALLVRKKYCDLTGNNINHPNDFLARCYAMNLLQLFTENFGE